jgi:hypothetical protein
VKLGGRVPSTPPVTASRLGGVGGALGTAAWAWRSPAPCRRAPMRHPLVQRLRTCRRGSQPHLIYGMLHGKIGLALFLDFALRSQLFCMPPGLQSGVMLRAPARAPATPHRIQALLGGHRFAFSQRRGRVCAGWGRCCGCMPKQRSTPQAQHTHPRRCKPL